MYMCSVEALVMKLWRCISLRKSISVSYGLPSRFILFNTTLRAHSLLAFFYELVIRMCFSHPYSRVFICNGKLCLLFVFNVLITFPISSYHALVCCENLLFVAGYAFACDQCPHHED